MILFGWRKRIALSMCCFLFLASISYLTGVVNLSEADKNADLKSSRYLNFFSSDSLLRIFNKPFQANLVWEEKGDKNLVGFGIKSINRRRFLDYLKKYLKIKIIEKLQALRPTLRIKEKDFVGYFLYKWISGYKLLVTIKFKLLSSSESSWYYDQFSVTLKG